jgi:hypothetical protein
MNHVGSCLFGVILIMAQSHANALEIPYTSGKISGSINIVMKDPAPEIYPGGYKIDPGTLQFGNVFSFSIHFRSGFPNSGSCPGEGATNRKFIVGVSTIGTVMRLPDSGSYWSDQDVHPASTALVTLDTITPPGGASIPAAYVLAQEGNCEGTSTSMTPKWNQVVYVRNGSTYAKFAVTAHKDTSWGILPFYKFVQKITVRYIVNDTNELGGAVVAVRPLMRSKARDRLEGGYDLYSPLGVKLDRNSKRYSPALPADNIKR